MVPPRRQFPPPTISNVRKPSKLNTAEPASNPACACCVQGTWTAHAGPLGCGKGERLTVLAQWWGGRGGGVQSRILGLSWGLIDHRPTHSKGDRKPLTCAHVQRDGGGVNEQTQTGARGVGRGKSHIPRVSTSDRGRALQVKCT